MSAQIETPDFDAGQFDDGYKPSPWQQRFHDLRVNEALGAGAAGPGKSVCLLMDCNLRLVGEHNRTLLPKRHPSHIDAGRSVGWALHLRRTYPMLSQTLARAERLFKVMDPRVRWDGENHMYIFHSGYRYQFGHCQNPNDWQKYHSSQYDYLAFDELTQFNLEQYEQIGTRLRSSDPFLLSMLYRRSMSNPLMLNDSSENFKVYDPHWVRKRFVDHAPDGNTILVERVRRKDGREEKLTRIYLPAKLHDNPNKAYVEQYELQLLSKPMHIRQAMLEGDWYTVPDAYYGEWWSKQGHTCAPFAIPEDWPIFRSMDWGFKTQGTVGWYAIDPSDGVLYKIYELNFKLKYADEVADMIIDVEEKIGLPSSRRRGSCLTGVADTQLWEKKGDVGASKAETMASKGVAWVPANKSNRKRNAQLLLKRLRDHRNWQTLPGIIFFLNCSETIKTLPAIPTDPNDSENPMDGGEDHWHDETLYACEFASRSRPSVSREEEDEIDVEPLIQAEGPSYGYYR